MLCLHVCLLQTLSKLLLIHQLVRLAITIIWPSYEVAMKPSALVFHA